MAAPTLLGARAPAGRVGASRADWGPAPGATWGSAPTRATVLTRLPSRETPSGSGRTSWSGSRKQGRGWAHRARGSGSLGGWARANLALRRGEAVPEPSPPQPPTPQCPGGGGWTVREGDTAAPSGAPGARHCPHAESQRAGLATPTTCRQERGRLRGAPAGPRGPDPAGRSHAGQAAAVPKGTPGHRPPAKVAAGGGRRRARRVRGQRGSSTVSTGLGGPHAGHRPQGHC